MSKIVHSTVTVSDPPLAQRLFGDRRLAWLWIVPRLYLGYQWFDASQHKISDPKWVQTGEALKGFWQGVVVTQPRPVAYFDWYRGFIQFLLDTQSYTWFAKLVAYGELIVGIALILGAFTGIAAFFGGFMNWNFIMAGSASTNPLLFAVAIFLVLAWKTAGYYGLDRVLLPMLGTPWRPAFQVKPAAEPASS